MADAYQVRQFILTNVERLPRGLAQEVARHFSMSRQAANRHIARLVDEGLLLAHGETRTRSYELGSIGSVVRTIPLTPALEEHAVWDEFVMPLLASVSANVRDICNYGFTEMVNNAKDHSESPSVTITANVTASTIILGIEDQGVGIFTKIKNEFGLDDDRHAILELVKGKVTTDPTRHTGEGIFFTSRMFDQFGISSGHLSLMRLRQANDYLVEEAEPLAGTWIVMKIATRSEHTTTEVFDRYSVTQDDYAFQRTHVVVSLARAEGEALISRSQAKRVVARLDRFKEVVLDFKGLDSIGPAFADEIFRVWAAAHPAVRLNFVDASDEVRKMIRRAQGSSPS